MISQQKPKVSIGMPVYNGEKFIREALDSLLAQTFTDFELIISDNASTDGTEAICREYASRDLRIRYVRQPVNRGAVANFQFVLDESVGEYFMWAADDDSRSENYIEALLTGFYKYPSASIVFTDAIIVDDHNLLKEDKMLSQMNHRIGGFESRGLSFIDKHKKQTKDTCLHIYGLINPVYLTNYPWFDIEFGNDVPILHWLLTHGDFVYVPKAMFYFFQKKGRSPDDVALSISLHQMRPYPCVRFSWICARSVKMASLNAGIKERCNVIHLFFMFYIRYRCEGMIILMKRFLYGISPTWLRLIWGRIKSKEALDEK